VQGIAAADKKNNKVAGQTQGSKNWQDIFDPILF